MHAREERSEPQPERPFGGRAQGQPPRQGLLARYGQGSAARRIDEMQPLNGVRPPDGVQPPGSPLPPAGALPFAGGQPPANGAYVPVPLAHPEASVAHVNGPGGTGQESALVAAAPGKRRKDGPLRGGVIESLVFLTITTLVGRSAAIISTLILAKILSPSDFGVVSIVQLIISSFLLVRLSFFFQTLMHRKTEVREAADVTYWASWVSGLVLCLLTFVAAPAVGGFFNNPLIVPVLRLAGLAFFVSSVGQVQDTLFEKELQFRRKSLAEASQPIINAVCAVGMALVGFGVFSIAWADVISSGIWAIWISLISPYRPSLKINWRVFRELVGYGRYVFAGAVVWLIFNNLDNASIGRILGAKALGYYAFAYTFANFASIYITGMIVSSVLLPVFSKLQDDVPAQRQALDNTLRYVGLYTAPFTIGLIVLAGPFVHALYGNKWDDAVLPLQILALYGLANSYGTIVKSVCNGVGKAKAFAWLSYLQLGLTLPMIYWAPVHFGLAGTAWNFTAAKILSTIVAMLYALRLVKASPGLVAWRIVQPLLVALCAGAGVLVFQWLTPGVDARAAFCLEAAVYVAIFAAVYVVIDPNLFVEGIAMLLHRRGGPRTQTEPVTMGVPILASSSIYATLNPTLATSPSGGSSYAQERRALRPMRLTSFPPQQRPPASPPPA